MPRALHASLLAAFLSLTGCQIPVSLPITAADLSAYYALPRASIAQTPIPAATGSKLATAIVVNTENLVMMVHKTQQVRATVTYTDGTKDENVSWTSSDNTVAAINPTTGEISGVAPGIATIQAKVPGNIAQFANITVTIKPGVIQDALAFVQPADGRIRVGETLQLKAVIQNTAGKTTPNGSWATSNERVAMVSVTGLVTGIHPGVATISFSSDLNTGVQATATITVLDTQAAP